VKRTENVLVTTMLVIVALACLLYGLGIVHYSAP
jgi:hypothetical protein